jgi:hypothetical protein
MDKCAKQYCDFWNEAEKTCALALEVHEKVELLKRLNSILSRLEKKGRERKSAEFTKNLTKMEARMH